MLDLTVCRTFAASPERLFLAWSDATWVRRWFGCGAMTVPEAEVDFRVGGRYRIVMEAPDEQQHVVEGEYLEIVPNERIRFSWQWAGSPVRTEVALTFAPVAGGCELQLLHQQFPSIEARDEHEHGWQGCLDRLCVALVEREGVAL